MSTEPGKRKDLYEQWVADGDDEDNLKIMKSLALQGIPMDKIADEFGIKERQLRVLKKRHNAVNAALKKGRQHVVAEAQDALRRRIVAGDTGAIIYALKIYGGDFFNDRARVEIKGEVDANVSIDGLRRRVDGLSDEELDRLIANTDEGC